MHLRLWIRMRRGYIVGRCCWWISWICCSSLRIHGLRGIGNLMGGHLRGCCLLWGVIGLLRILHYTRGFEKRNHLVPYACFVHVCCLDWCCLWPKLGACCLINQTEGRAASLTLGLRKCTVDPLRFVSGLGALLSVQRMILSLKHLHAKFSICMPCDDRCADVSFCIVGEEQKLGNSTGYEVCSSTLLRAAMSSI